MLRFILTVLALFSFAVPGWAGEDCASAWRLVYRHDSAGAALAGAKADLLAAIRRGDPVRVAWGGRFALKDGRTLTVEHSADPVFLTIVGETEVVIQLPEHIAQATYSDISRARFDDPAVMWRGLMTTTGRFDAVWINRATGAEVRRAPQRVSLAWFSFSPPPKCETRAPLVLAVPGGVANEDAPAKP